MTENNTQAINKQRDNYYYANFMDNKCSKFAQGWVAAKIAELIGKENDYLREMIDAQSKNIGSSIGAGFGTAGASIIEGAFESAGAAGTAGAGGYQAKETVKNAAKIRDLQGITNTNLAEYKKETNLNAAGKIKGDNSAATNATQNPETLEVKVERVDSSNSSETNDQVVAEVREQPSGQTAVQTQPQAAQPASQTQTPVSTSQPIVADVEATVNLNASNGVTRADPATSSTLQVDVQAPETLATPTNTPPTATAPTAEQPAPETPVAARKPDLGTSTSKLESNNIVNSTSEEKILSEHKTEQAALEQENQRSTQIGSVIQAGSQAFSQLPTQGSRASGQVNRTGQETFDKTAAASKAAADSVGKTVGDLSHINPFQQNESLRA